MTDTPEFEIARFLRRLQWAAVGVGACWLLWLLAPILTPFAVAALLGWLGDPLVDRLSWPDVPATPRSSWCSR